MNDKGKAVGPYKVYGQNSLGVWRLAAWGLYERLRGEGGAIPASKEMLADGCRVAMIVDADDHVTHIQYWGLAQPRTIKLQAGTYDFFEAQEVYRLVKERQRARARVYQDGTRRTLLDKSRDRLVGATKQLMEVSGRG